MFQCIKYKHNKHVNQRRSSALNWLNKDTDLFCVMIGLILVTGSKKPTCKYLPKVQNKNTKLK